MKKLINKALALFVLIPAVVLAGSGVSGPNPKLYTDAVRADLASTAANKGAALVGFKASGVGAVNKTLQSKAQESVSVVDFGGVGNGTTDDYAAFRAALDALPDTGGTLIIPVTASNTWRLSQKLEIYKSVRIVGMAAPTASASVYNAGTVLKFDADKDGLVLHAYNTASSWPAVILGANYSVIENLAIVSSGGKTGLLNGGTGVAVDGMQVLGPGVKVRNVWVWYFHRYGIRIDGECGANGPTAGNANLWQLDNVNLQLNGSDGLYINGACSNAGMSGNVNASNNGGWGIYDSSFLGNTHVGAHAEANTLGAYKTDDTNASSVFLGCYAETGNTSSFVAPTIVIGGLASSEASLAASTTAFVMGGGGAYKKPVFYRNKGRG